MIGLAQTDVAAVRNRQARMMLVRAFLAHNVAIGCAFGGFATSILALQARFDTSRGMAAMALALTVLTMSGLGPLVAMMIAKVRLRGTMILGLLLSALGYGLLASARSIEVTLAVCMLVIGPGAALLGAVPPSILAASWHPHARGRATGIAYIPLFVTFVPLIGVEIIQQYGLPAFFMTLAGMHLLLLPVLLGVSEPPVDSFDEREGSSAAGACATLRSILSFPIFWAIMLGEGILNASTITGSAHIVAIAVEYGIATHWATLLLSIKGGASILGSIFSGVACDKFGAAWTLSITGVGLALSWVIIQTSGWFPALAVAMMVMGISGAAIFPPVTVLVAEVFGVAALPRVLGLMGAFTLPFTFCAPLAGWLRDTMSNYETAILLLISVSLVAVLNFACISRKMGNRRQALI